MLRKPGKPRQREIALSFETHLLRHYGEAVQRPSVWRRSIPNKQPWYAACCSANLFRMCLKCPEKFPVLLGFFFERPIDRPSLSVPPGRAVKPVARFNAGSATDDNKAIKRAMKASLQTDVNTVPAKRHKEITGPRAGKCPMKRKPVELDPSQQPLNRSSKIDARTAVGKAPKASAGVVVYEAPAATPSDEPRGWGEERGDPSSGAWAEADGLGEPAARGPWAGADMASSLEPKKRSPGFAARDESSREAWLSDRVAKDNECECPFEPW